MWKQYAFLGALSIQTVSYPTADKWRPHHNCVSIMGFDKSSLTGAFVSNPLGNDPFITVSRNSDGSWTDLQTQEVIQKSVINRLKNEFNDVCSRGTLTHTEEPEMYGLGTQAAHIHLLFDDGTALGFSVGDPNPTSAFFFIREHNGGQIHKVKKKH